LISNKPIFHIASRSGTLSSRRTSWPAVIMALFLLNSCGLFGPNEDTYLRNYATGNDLMKEERYAEAISYFKKAFRQNRQFEPIFQKLATCFQKTEELDSAIVYYMGAIAYNRSNLKAYRAIEEILIMQGKHNEAELWHQYSIEVEDEENEPSPYSAPTIINPDYLIKDYKIDHLQKLYARTYNNMGTKWFYRDDFKKAKYYYEKAITVDATYPRAYYGLGLVALQEKNVKEAESRFIDAFEVAAMPEAIYMLGQLYYDTKQKEKSLVWFRKYLEKESTGQWAEKAKDMIFLLEQELPVDK